MASSVEKEGGASEETFSLELPAPPGWKKKVWHCSSVSPFLHFFFCTVFDYFVLLKFAAKC